MGIKERKEREKMQRETDILDAAEKVFQEKGFKGATMDEIAQVAELSKGTLYLYFKSREDIHFSIALRALKELGILMEKRFDPGLAVSDSIINFGRNYLSFSRKHPLFFESLITFDSRDIEKVSVEKKARVLEDGSPLMILINQIQRGQREGEIRSDFSPQEMAVMLWAQVNGLLQFVFFRPKLVEMLDLDQEKLLTQQFDLLYNGIKAKEDKRCY